MGKSKNSGRAAKKPKESQQFAAPAQHEFKSSEIQFAASSSSRSSGSSAAQPLSASSYHRQGPAGRTANEVVPKRFAMPRSKSPPLHNHHIQTPWENVRPPREGYPDWYETTSEVQWYLTLPDQFPAVRKPKGHH